ncbi:hypothetical protein Hypma_002051 [Hypsizygus marmoreus]|uniref:Translation initiation factor IF-3 n=1 Tax=Hypsizygus marmoreus TaxID=39966 RepID=A0A369J781_HYPMA|nr:hypothetical protein Hypma_002051 [Hypsizygus marmoreus]
MSSFIAFRTAAFSLLRPKLYRIPCLHQQQLRRIQKDASKPAKGASKAYPRDEEIEHEVVQLVDSTTGRLTDPQPLRSILSSIDRKNFFVELVSVTPSPLVKIISKYDTINKRRQDLVRAQAVARKNVTKEVQLTWGAAAADQTHKLERVRHELERGSRVDLIFSHKKKQVLPTPVEMRERVQEVVDMFADVSKEWKDREVRGTMSAIFLQGNTFGEPDPDAQAKRPQIHKPKQKR